MSGQGSGSQEPPRDEEARLGERGGRRRRASLRPVVPPIFRPRSQSETSTQPGAGSSSSQQTAEGSSSSRQHPVVEPRMTVQPHGSTWIPGHEATNQVSRSILGCGFEPTAYTWRLVSDAKKMTYFEEFKKECVWAPEHDDQMWKNFEKYAAERYKDLLFRMREKWYKKGEATDLGTDSENRPIWDQFLRYWDSPEFQEKSAKNKANRRSDPDGEGMARHRAGSRSIYEHGLRFAAEQGREPSHFERLQLAHPLVEETGKSTYGRTTEIHRKMLEDLASQPQPEETAEGSGSMPPTQPSVDVQNELYFKNVKAKKGRFAGLGSFGKNFFRPRGSGSSSSQSSIDSHPSEVERQLATVVEQMKNMQRQQREKEEYERQQREAHDRYTAEVERYRAELQEYTAAMQAWWQIFASDSMPRAQMSALPMPPIPPTQPSMPPIPPTQPSMSPIVNLGEDEEEDGFNSDC